MNGSRSARPRVVLAAPYGEGILRWLEAQPVELHAVTARTAAELASAARGAHVLITRAFQRIDASVLDAAGPQLAAVIQASAGRDNIDEQQARRRGVQVVIVDPHNATAVAELTLLSLLALARNVRAHWDRTAAGRWTDRDALQDRQLAGKRLGIVGLGRVGSRVATRAAAFSMTVLAYDPYLDDEAFARFGVERCVDLDALVSRCDAISLHCPLTAETHAMFDARRLALAPTGALLVNTARGGLVVEADLLAALDDGRLAGAALDVFENEPPAGELSSALVAHPAILCTPHLAGHTVESRQDRREALARALVEQIERLTTRNS